MSRVAEPSMVQTSTEDDAERQPFSEHHDNRSTQATGIKQIDTRSRQCYGAMSPTDMAEPRTQNIEVEPTDMVPEVTCQQGPSRRAPFLPCVLPQTSKSFRGAFFSPFVRAYAPELDAYGISQSDFLAFVDDLNEVFIAHPVFQGLGTAGAVMSMAHGVHPVQWAGIGLQTASGAASAATSYMRTKTYLTAINDGLFRPVGLHVNIMTTEKMAVKVGYPQKELRLLPLATLNDPPDPRVNESHSEPLTSTGEHDPSKRRLDALQGHVMPVTFDVPDSVQPDGLLSKMSAAQVKRQNLKQQKKLCKDRGEGDKKYMEKTKDADKEMRKGNKEIMKLEKELTKEKEKCQAKVAKAEGDSKKSSRVLQEYHKKEEELLHEIQKETKKRDKEVGKFTREAEKERSKVERKEQKIANKVRWIVISQWSGEQVEEDSLEDEDASP